MGKEVKTEHTGKHRNGLIEGVKCAIKEVFFFFFNVGDKVCCGLP